MLSRINNQKFNLNEKEKFGHYPEVFCNYLANRLKKFSCILQFGAESANQLEDVLFLQFVFNKQFLKVS